MFCSFHHRHRQTPNSEIQQSTPTLHRYIVPPLKGWINDKHERFGCLFSGIVKFGDFVVKNKAKNAYTICYVLGLTVLDAKICIFFNNEKPGMDFTDKR